MTATFTFYAGSFEGTKRQYHLTGYVVDKLPNATWRMKFVWPFKADYPVVYLDATYSQTIIRCNQRDYGWIMARRPDKLAPGTPQIAHPAIEVRPMKSARLLEEATL